MENSQKNSPLRKIISSKTLFFLLIFALLFFLVSLVREMGQQSGQSITLRETENLVRNMERENERLVGRLGQLQSDIFQEKEAREKLGLQKPGERVIIITEKDSQELSFEESEDTPGLVQRNEKTAPREEQSLFSNLKNWWRYFANSVR